MTLVVAVAAPDGVAVVADGRASLRARHRDGTAVRQGVPATKVARVAPRVLVGFAGDVALCQAALRAAEAADEPADVALALAEATVRVRGQARARLERVFGDNVPEVTPLVARFVVAGRERDGRGRLLVVNEVGDVRDTTAFRHAVVGSSYVPQHFVSAVVGRQLPPEATLAEAANLATGLVEHVAALGFPGVLGPVRTWVLPSAAREGREATAECAGARERFLAARGDRPRLAAPLGGGAA